MTANWQGVLQGWNSLLVQTGTVTDLPVGRQAKDIIVQVNKQKPGDVSAARMMHKCDKMTIVQMYGSLAAKQMLFVRTVN